MIIDFSRSNTAVTVIPTRRKGRESSHTNGNIMRARKASGQHRKRRINHNNNFCILSSFDKFVSNIDPKCRSIIYTKVSQESSIEII